MTEKSELIKALEEMAVLMELRGINPFKVRAFSNASRILQRFSGDFKELIEKGNFTTIKGIGKGIESFLLEIITTGNSVELLDLKREIPAGVLDLLKIPGLGPKKAKILWEKLNIKSIGELEYACLENRLLDLDGFGAKTQEKILNGIEQVKKYSQLHLISTVRSEADKIYTALNALPGVIRCEIAGSIRRFRETVKDIDIVLSIRDEDRSRIIDDFINLPEIDLVTGKGQTKCSAVLKSGINVDLRMVSDEQFPFALHHFTGSKDHNIAMRALARENGLKMNEYGLFDEKENTLKCENESEIFSYLSMSYIPPELREDMGEIDAALKHELPELVSLADIRGIIHVHSNYSDGLNTIAELAEAARKKGFEYLVICDHSKSASYANGLTEERILQQIAEIDRINASFTDFKVFKGIECDILMDGTLDYTERVLSLFDVVIASIHSGFQMSEREATDRMLRALDNPHVMIIGHPTGRLLLAREGYPIDMTKIIESAASKGVSIELNANPHRLDIDWRLLKPAREKGIKISINPDAHRIEGYNDIEYGVGVARKGWLSPDDVLNSLSLEKFQKYIDTHKQNV